MSGLSFSGWGFLLLLPLIPLGWWLARFNLSQSHDTTSDHWPGPVFTVFE